MEARIQQALDEQWDALEARSPRVKKVRRHLGQLLDEFASQKQAELADIDVSIDGSRTRVHDIEKANKQRGELRKLLEAENSSTLSQELASLTMEVRDLDSQILELEKRRAQAERRRRELESVVSSRTAKFRDALADLDKKHPTEDASTIHAMQSQLAKMEQQKRGIGAELNAAKGGQDMWRQVCQELDALDRDIRGLKRDQLDRISFLLKRKLTLLESLATSAQEAGWTALVIAIGHELQVLGTALEALDKAERGSSTVVS